MQRSVIENSITYSTAITFSKLMNHPDMCLMCVHSEKQNKTNKPILFEYRKKDKKKKKQ